MDFTALISGSAQAGHPAPVSKPGIGLTAGAGASPTDDAPGGAGDFASLVDLALGQLGGDAEHGSASGTAGTAARSTDDEGDAAVVDDATAPADAPVDAATLAVLIALATPPAATTPPPAAPQADAAGQASAELAALDGAATGSSIMAAETAVDGAAPRTTTAAGTPAAFHDILATAVPPAAAPAVPAADAASGSASTASAAAVPAPAVAPAVQPHEAAAAATAAAPAEVRPADRPAAAAPAVPAHTAGRPAEHPLRQALAALATESTAPAPGQAPAASQTTTAAVAPVAAQGAPVAADATPAASESRLAASAPPDAPASASAVSTFASGSGSTGDSSSSGSPEDAAAPTFRGAETRVDTPVPAGPSVTAGLSSEALASAAVTAVPGFGAGPSVDSGLRAIDLPAAARFEQTLSSLDPDVRNLQAMVRSVRLFTAGSGATEARLTLEPEHLGPVALTVRVEQGSVSAHFRAETAAAHRWIETHQQELRSGLRDQGLEVKEVVVTTDPDGRRERQQYEPPAKPRARRQAAADAPRFEVLV